MLRFQTPLPSFCLLWVYLFIYLFIYLLLVLKTKIASLFSALEAGGRMGGAVCAEAGSRGPWGACARVWGVERANPVSVRCAVCCVCAEHACVLRVACVLSGWVYKPASEPAAPGSGISGRFLDSLDPVVQRLELAEAPSALRR